VIYNNGPINGNTDGWAISLGFIVSDTFNVSNPNTTVSGFSFGAWLYPGDTLTSAVVSISTEENTGLFFFNDTLNFTQSNCVENSYGFNVCTETASMPGPSLNVGTYWINVQNASVASGDPVFWDENSGPSLASENTVGSIPSEAFTILGGASSSSTFDVVTVTGTVAEPSNIMLFGSAVLGLAGLLRRRIF
jgi:MYXO-CTERM domain-containing protein